MKVNDFAVHEDFAYKIQVILGCVNENVKSLMSYEAHCHLNGTVNKQNLHYWSTAYPHRIHQYPLHSEKVRLWFAVASLAIIGLIFSNKIGPVTVNSACYICKLGKFLKWQLRRQRICLKDVWFQQNGATAYTMNSSITALWHLFYVSQVFLHFSDFPWPPRSPN